MVYKFFNKKSAGSGVVTLANKSAIKSMPNQQLANELHKPIIKKFKSRRAHSSFKDNIWGVDLSNMQLTIKYSKGIRYLLCVIDLFSKYVWIVPMKDKKCITIVNAFQSILDSLRKKKWIHQGSEFHNSPFKKWLKENHIEMYSAYNEGKSVAAQRFIRTFIRFI